MSLNKYEFSTEHLNTWFYSALQDLECDAKKLKAELYKEQLPERDGEGTQVFYWCGTI